MNYGGVRISEGRKVLCAMENQPEPKIFVRFNEVFVLGPRLVHMSIAGQFAGKKKTTKTYFLAIQIVDFCKRKPVIQ